MTELTLPTLERCRQCPTTTALRECDSCHCLHCPKHGEGHECALGLPGADVRGSFREGLRGLHHKKTRRTEGENA